MKTDRWKWIALATLVTTGLSASCQKAVHQETERYYFITANVALPYWQEARAGFTDSARRLGVKVEFKGPETYSPEEELLEFQKAVAKNPSGILVSPTRPDLFKDAIDGAVKQGIPVICIDSDAPDSRRLQFVGTDNYEAGRESARRIAEILQGKGNIVVITITGQQNLDERLRGVNDELKKYPGIKITQTLNDRGDPAMANDQVAALLDAKEKFDGLLGLEASGGPGAASALHRLNLGGKIPIVAMDKNPETLDWISRGVISATIAQKPYTMAFYGLRFLDDLHHNTVLEYKDWKTAPTSPLPARVDTGTAVIDKTNLTSFQAAAVARTQPM